MKLRTFVAQPQLRCVNKQQLWDSYPTARALSWSTQVRKHFCFPGGKRLEPNTMYNRNNKRRNNIYRIYLDSLEKKIKYYKPSIEVAPCRHAIQKHFKICPWCFLVNISESAWNLIYVHRREYLLQFTVHIKTT